MADEITTGPWFGFDRPGDEFFKDSTPSPTQEIGFWNPVAVGYTTAGTGLPSTQQSGGLYVKTGRLVVLSFRCSFDNHTGTGIICIDGIPFPPQYYYSWSGGAPSQGQHHGFGTIYFNSPASELFVSFTLDQVKPTYLVCDDPAGTSGSINAKYGTIFGTFTYITR